MLESEKLAIAAHLHVLLRRKTGRVTDTEWMACNEAYATEIVRFARAKAAGEGHADLAEWAGRLEAALGLGGRSSAKAGTAPAAKAERPTDGAGGEETQRYVRGIR